MTFLLNLLFSFAIIFFPTSFVYWLFRKNSLSLGISRPKSQWFAFVLFLIYIVLVYDITGAGTWFELKITGVSFESNQLNLIPFSRDINNLAYFLNVVMFMPFGFLLPFILNNRLSFLKMTFLGLSFSTLIELSQLTNYRHTDVDDLIMNTIGAIIGYIFYRLIMHHKIHGSTTNNPVLEGIALCLTTIVSHFLLFGYVIKYTLI
ncbi:MAG: VanZ family protein [Tissierellia bacterium]|nr:VanZ family protein [Tissierellia bacterium]